MDELLEKGIKYFNAGYFFEAHDIFEEIWMDERGKGKQFYQGLVQLSTGFYHLTMGNLKGARSQLYKGKNKLLNFQPFFRNIEISQLLEKIENCIFEIESNQSVVFSFEKFKTRIPKLSTLER